MPSSLQFLAEQGSCWSARDCDLRMPRGSSMAEEVAAEVPSSAEYVPGITGTITELPPQSLTALKLSPWMQLAGGTVDLLYPKV